MGYVLLFILFTVYLLVRELKEMVLIVPIGMSFILLIFSYILLLFKDTKIGDTSIYEMIARGVYKIKKYLLGAIFICSIFFLNYSVYKEVERYGEWELFFDMQIILISSVFIYTILSNSIMYTLSNSEYPHEYALRIKVLIKNSIINLIRNIGIYFVYIFVLYTSLKILEIIINRERIGWFIIIALFLMFIIVVVYPLVFSIIILELLDEVVDFNIILSSSMIYYEAIGENKKNIDANEARLENELKEKREKLKIELEEKKSRALRGIYYKANEKIKNIMTREGNIFEEMAKPIVIKKKYFNNDQKFEYYNKLFKGLNYKYKGDYEKYIDLLVKKEESLSNKLNRFGYNFSTTNGLLNSNKIKRFFSSELERVIREIKSDFKVCKAGLDGEDRVNKEINLYSNIINLQNIRLEVKDSDGNIQSVENDNILLSKNGIFILEVKNYGEIGRYDIIVERDGRWLKRYIDRNRHERIDALSNASQQNNRHIAFVNKFINEHLNRDFDNYIEAEGIVVISNETVNIKNSSKHQNIFRASEVYSFIKSKSPKLTKDELEKIKVAILENNLPSKVYPIEDYSTYLFETIKNFDMYLKEYESIVLELEEEYSKYIEQKKHIEQSAQYKL